MSIQKLADRFDAALVAVEDAAMAGRDDSELDARAVKAGFAYGMSLDSILIEIAAARQIGKRAA